MTFLALARPSIRHAVLLTHSLSFLGGGEGYTFYSLMISISLFFLPTEAFLSRDAKRGSNVTPCAL